MLKLRHSGSRAALVPKRRRAANRRVRLKGKPLPSLREIAGKIASPMRKHARASMSLLLIGAAIAAPFGVGYLVTHAQHFAVKTVAFSQTDHVDAGRLEKRLQNVVGSNLFLVESAAIEQQLLREPWLKSVKIHRELPGTLRIDVEERHAAAAVALDAIYLVDASGTPFKRATAEEAAHLPIPIITGLSRDRFAREKVRSLQLIRDAMAVNTAWYEKQSGKQRPELAEVHVDRLTGVTLYTMDGQGIRLGLPDDSLAARLERVEIVLGELKRRGEQARMIYADNRSRPDRISVRLKGSVSLGGPTQEKES